MKTIPAGEFKTHCLSLMDEVGKTREPIVVTKRGRPVAKVVPVEPEKKDDLFGSWADRGRIVGDIVSPIVEEDEWDCLK